MKKNRSKGHGSRAVRSKAFKERYEILCKTTLHCKPPAKKLGTWIKAHKLWVKALAHFKKPSRALYAGYTDPGPYPIGKHRNR